ncbi:MAG: AAA family ATPase [Chitinophagaceae bacterium]
MKTTNRIFERLYRVYIKCKLWVLSIALFQKKDKPAFGNGYIDAKLFYLNRFKKIPSVTEICDVSLEEVIALIKTEMFGKIKRKYNYNSFEWEKNRLGFETIVFELESKIVIWLGYDDVFIYHQFSYNKIVNQMIEEFKKHKAAAKEEPFEMNIITLNKGELELKAIEINPQELDIDTYYNDDFKAIDSIIKERLNKEKDKGIVLLHGLPGTGKTTYLRHLIGTLKKKVMFVSSSAASDLMNPVFMDLLIDNPNCILIIEDAENVIMDRRFSSQSSVSNLLNISDGLMSDCLNVQIICTFNSEISYIDSALMRKGRLIAKYEFGKLSVEKANKLSNHLGLNNVITKPLTLAEITNQDESNYEVKQHAVIGFRRDLVYAN